jgi:two-component system sensor kinase FixL
MIATDDILPRMEPILQQIGDAIVVTSADLDPPGQVLFVNRAFTELTGYAPIDAIGQSLPALWHSKADRETLSRLKHALDAHRCFFGETACYRKDGSEITLEWHAIPLRDQGDAVRYCVNLLWDASRSANEAVGTGIAERGRVGEGGVSIQEELADHLRRRTAEFHETILRLHEQIAERLQAGEALRESERRFKDFASSSSDWFWEMGADLRFIWLSDQFERLSGISPNKVVGGTREQLGRSDPGDAAWARHLDDLRARRPFRDFRYRAWRDDGDEVHFSVSGVPVFDGEGRFQGYRGTGTNITAEVQAEKQAVEARVRLREAIESISEGFMLFDADDRLVLYNNNVWQALPGIADILTPGARFEDLVRAVAERGYIVEALGRTEDWVQERLQRHRALSSPLEQHYVDGQWTQVNEYRTRDGGTLLIRTDITDRKQVEEALRQSDERVQLAVSGTRDGLWDRDLVAGKVWYSPVWRQIIGLDEAEMESYVWRDWVHPDDLPRALEAMEDYFAGKTPFYQCVYRHRHKDGHWIWIEARATCVRDEKGTPVRYTGRFSDISKRVKAEERSRKLQVELEHVARLNIMGELAAGIAHELHQPLTAITNYVQTARDLLEEAEGAGLQTVYEAMDRAVDQCQRAGQVIRRLREFMGKGETRRGLQDINTVIEESAALALVGATENGLELKLELDRGLPAVFVDKIQIQQVVANLIKNALDAMERSQNRQLTLRTSRHGGDAVEVEISDTGPGIAANVADRLFEPFVTTKPQGMGIGLSICRSIIEDHHGHLVANANEDGGATLRFTLPIGSEYTGRHG